MIKYVYVCSAGHSGSTLLDLLLGSHPRIASLGEIDHLPKNLALNTPCSCGSAVRECALWSRVVARVAEQLVLDINNDPYSLSLGYPRAHVVIDRRHQTRMYLLRRRILLGLYFLHARFGCVPAVLRRPIKKAAANSIVVFDTVRNILNIDTIVDSSKSYLRALSLHAQEPETVRILLLTRDGRGVLWSLLKRGTPRKAAVTGWKNQYERALPLLKRRVGEDHMLQVKYEDLTADPESELRRICEFIGHPYDAQMLDFRSKVHHVTNGNDMRLQSSSEIRLDTAWQSHLTADDLRYFERHAGVLNRLLGYS